MLRGLCSALFYAPSHGMIGLAHAGWKGTVQEIAKEMIQKWNAEGISSDEIHVAIGRRSDLVVMLWMIVY